MAGRSASFLCLRGWASLIAAGRASWLGPVCGRTARAVYAAVFLNRAVEFISGIGEGAEPAAVFADSLDSLSKSGSPVEEPAGADNPRGREVGHDGRQRQVLTAFDKMP
jgi:hypothetical protein